MKIGVIIGRFQLNRPHQAHRNLFEEAERSNDIIIILVGSSDINRTSNNPLTFSEREQILRKYFLTPKPLFIIELKDMPEDSMWSKQIDQILNSFKPAHFLLYGGRKSFIPHYMGEHQTVRIQAYDVPAASDFRYAIKSHFINDDLFIKGVIYGATPKYPHVYSTVDIAVIDSEENFLLGKKPNETKWRWPGGFVNPTDKSLEYAARRELKEEAGPLEVSQPEYICSSLIEDYRYKAEQSKVITNFFLSKYLAGSIRAGDDLEEVRWFPKEEVHEVLGYGHQLLFEKLRNNKEKWKITSA